jgi:hypothetical protein
MVGVLGLIGTQQTRSVLVSIIACAVTLFAVGQDHPRQITVESGRVVRGIAEPSQYGSTPTISVCKLADRSTSVNACTDEEIELRNEAEKSASKKPDARVLKELPQVKILEATEFSFSPDGRFEVRLKETLDPRAVIVVRQRIGNGVYSFSDKYFATSDPVMAPECRLDAPLRASIHTVAPQGDYVVITHDARTGAMFWSDKIDFNSGLDPFANQGETTKIWRTSALSPAIYTREKILVLVCNMHFGSSFSVQSSVVAMPEATADIRNGAIAGLPATTSTLDSLTGDSGPIVTAQIPDVTVNVGAIGFTADGVLTTADAKADRYAEALPITTANRYAQSIATNIEAARALRSQIKLIGCDSCPMGNTARLRVTISSTLAAVEGQMKSPDHIYAQESYLAAARDTQAIVSQMNALNGTLTALYSNPSWNTIASNQAALEGGWRLIESQIARTSDTCAKVDKPTVPADTPDYRGDVDKCAKNEKLALQQYQRDVCQALIGMSYDLACNGDAGADIATLMIKNHLAGQSRLLGSVNQDIEVSRIQLSALFDALNQWYSDSRMQDVRVIQPQTQVGNIQVSVAIHDSRNPFMFGASPSAAAPASSSTLSTSSHSTLVIEVHREVYFNVVGGAVALMLPTKNYALQPCVDSATNKLSSTDFCPTVSSSSSVQVQGMAGVSWTPWGRDYFPFGSHGAANDFGWHSLLPSILIGTSVTSLGNGFAGANFEPVHGTNIFLGIANGQSQELPQGITTNSVFTKDQTLTLQTRQRGAFAFGVGFDYGIFCSIFKKGCGS